MNTTSPAIAWTMPQACGDCGTDAAFIRRADGAAICRECAHEHDMDRTQLGADESFNWVGGQFPGWDAVLYVTAYEPSEEES